jgi:feruloyl esterase
MFAPGSHRNHRQPPATGVAGSLLTLAVAASVSTTAMAAPCENLASVAIPETTITVAQSVSAGTFTPPIGAPIVGLPAFCRVALTIAPSTDSHINVEVWMPAAGWNGRFEGTGGGGYTGAISYGALATGVQLGYAVANTDMGTAPATVLDGTALVGHPQRWLDFGSRSTHEMTVAAKTLVEAFYETPPRHSYFTGCSTGGHQALAEAQVFPDDYDGILGGAPGHNRTHLHTAFVWDFAVPHKSPGAFIPFPKLVLLNTAVLAACVGKDGGLATDAFLTDPRECGFDPASLTCPAGDAPNCLTAQQVDTAEKFYGGPRNPRTHELIYPGWPRGSEPNWVFLEDPSLFGLPFAPAFEGITTWALGLNYNPLTVDFDSDMAKVDAVLAPTVNFMNTDLSRFSSRGGKFILYQGFADFIVSAQDTINYYQRIRDEQNLTLDEEQAFIRLFMVPGMGHCAGGPGPNSFDALSPLVQWVEQGVAPGRIVATKYVNDDPSQGVQMTRPLCAYPQEARYVGSGDATQAASFACVADAGDESAAELPGRDYLAPLILQAKMTPEVINVRNGPGVVTAFITVPQGSDSLTQWMIESLALESAPALSTALVGGGRTFMATFDRKDLSNFTGGVPAGQPVDVMLTGTLLHNGSQSLFSIGPTVRILR